MMIPSLAGVWKAMDLAREARRTVRQNMAWAVMYNLTALPLAAAGLIAPWMAAIGMSASSLLVVLNSARLSRRQSRTGTKPDSGSVSPDTSLATPGRQQ